MKKFASLLLTFLMVFVLASCGEKADPKATYQAALEKNAALTELDVQMDMDIESETNGISVPVTSSVGIKANLSDKENPMFAMTMNMDMGGISFDIPIYYKDGYMYMEVLGQKMKQQTDMAEAMKSFGTQDTQALSAFTDDMISSAAFAEGNENQIILTLNSNALSSLSEMMFSNSQEAVPMDDMTIKTLTATIDIKDGYIVKQVVNLEGTVTTEGQESSVKCLVTSTINNPGQSVTIDFPDFSDFVEVEGDSSFLS